MKHIQKLFSVLLILGMLLGFLNTGISQAQNIDQNPKEQISEKIEKLLTDKFSTDGTTDFIVEFAQQADLTPAYKMGWVERGEFVYDTLKKVAETSQSSSIAMLEKLGLRYQTFINGNELYVWGGNLDAASALTELPEVELIRTPRTYHIDPATEEAKLPFVPAWAGDILANGASYNVSVNATMDWGITDTKADQFWSAFGFKGQGIVVANIDTGVQWNHPALDQSFKCGSNPADPNCWKDPSNVCGAGGACDNNGHGTHTMGTMVADDDDSLTYIAGMAPDAQWIACKGCESGSCSEAALNSCADWIVAPNGNPANRPNVVNNSWGGGGGDPWYLSKVNAWRAAGIFPAFSAGNNYSCSSLGSPGDYQESFATAAHSSNRVIAGFSSKGPSPYGHDPYTKPNISAPGDLICSSVPTNGWDCTFSGTSMASPHSAGAVALLWSCNPSLVGNIDATFQILQSTADAPPAGSCGAPPDGQGNNTYGYGYLDILAAGQQYCVSDWGAINGHAYNAVNNAPIADVTVTGNRSGGGTWSDATDASGYYTMTVGVGSYTVEAVHPQYTTGIVNNLDVPTNTVVTQDFYLQPRGHLFGYVTDQDSGAPLAATVTVTGGPSISTDPVTGSYEFYLDPGTYDVTASAPDYADETTSVTLAVGSNVQHDFSLLAAIAVVPDPIAISLQMGQTGSVASQLTNNMTVPYPFEIKEKAPNGLLVGEDILVVRKDSTAATAMENALTILGVSFVGITDTAFQGMTVPQLLQYQAVFYAGITGTTGTPSASENLLVAYLDAGGQLYISDNDLGYYRKTSVFYDTYLQATYVADNGGELLVGENLMAGLNPDVTSDPYPDSFTVGSQGTRIFKWSAADNAGGVLVQRQGYKAVYTSFDFQYITSTADEIELINRIVGLFVSSNIPWLDTSISGGTAPAGATISWTDAFSATTAAGIGQPGEYDALLKISPVGDPSLPDKQIAVHMTVLPTSTFGELQGTVTSDRPGGPLEADILIEASDGTTVTLSTDPVTGFYSWWLEEGSYDLTVSSPGYITHLGTETIVGGQTTVADFELSLNQPQIVVTPEALAKTLTFGDSGTQVLNIANTGPEPLTWELHEGNAGAIQVNSILLMADDVTAANWDIYRAALNAAGVSWDEWNLDTLSFPTAGELAPYSILIWADEDTLTPDNAQCQIVADWLNSGGKSLFATGIDFMWDIANGTPGSGENNLYVLFNTTYTGDYAGTGITRLNGVAGDPIGGDFVDPNGLVLAGTSDSNGDYANLASAATTGLIYGAGGTGSGSAGLTHFEGTNYKIAWLGVNFHNGLTGTAQRDTLMANILAFLGGGGDVPWLSETPTSGTLQPGQNVDVTVTFDSSMVPEPGVYPAELRAVSNDPYNNPVDIPVTMTVNPSVNIGKLDGVVTSDRPGGPLEGDVLIESTGGMTWTVTTDPLEGYYYKWLDAGDYTITASSNGYISQEVMVSVTGGMTTTQDFELVLLAPEISVDPDSLEQTLQMGDVASQNLNISNLGNEPLTFEIDERNGGYTPANQGEDILVVAHDTTAATAMETALTALDYTYLQVSDAQFQAMTVDQLLEYMAVFHAGTTGYSGAPSASETLLMAYLDAGGSLFISDNDLGFYRNGSAFYDIYLQSTYDIDNAGDYVDGLNLMTGLTLDITADPYPDGITVGAEGTPIFQFQGSAEMNGTAVDRNGYRAVYTGFDFHNIADASQEIEVVQRVLDFIAVSDAPWLFEEPITGTVNPGGTLPVQVTFDAGVASDPGVYTAQLRIKHNDPLAGSITVPVTMTVEPSPDYGRLEGTVTGLGYCDEDPGPLEAEVLIVAEDGMSWTVNSNPNTGFYFRWLLSGTYTVTASAEGYVPVTEVVEVTAPETTIQNFDLRLIESCMSWTPPSFSVSLPADSQQTEMLTLNNDGAGEVIWEVHETTRTVGLEGVSIPRFTGTIPEDKTPVSIEKAPASSGFTPIAGQPIINTASPAFAMDLGSDSLYNIPDLDFPGTWNLVSTPGVTSAYAGDFGPDTDTLYLIGDDAKTLYAVDPDTGTATAIGPAVPLAGQLWTGMAWDPTTQTMYASATDGTTATLFTINLATGTATQVGTIVGAPYAIDIAVSGAGQMYTVDIAQDALLTVDKTTGATQYVGSIGFNANYAQGMDFDLDNNILYMSAYTSADGNLRIIDTSTGNSVMVGTFAGGAEVDALAVDAAGIPPWNEVPWVTEVPTNGVLGPDSTFDVAVTFDTTGLTPGQCYNANLGLVHDDPNVANPSYIPLELCVTEPTYGVNLEPEDTQGSGAPGDEVTYTLHLTNLGNTADSFELTLSNVEPGWNVVLPITSFNLDAGETVDVLVVVAIPAGVGDGDLDTFTVTATSTHDATVFDAVDITTTVNIDIYDFYLPLISRK